MKKSCAVAVPCYNEAERLDLTAFRDFISTHPEVVFIFVNDGSRDGTEEILKDFCSQNNAQYITLEKNSGKAEAVRQGMKTAESFDVDYIGFFDADLATPLSELERMLQAAENEYVYISGCRLLRLGGNISRKHARHYLGRVFATAVSLHLNLPVYDTQCGAKLYAKESIRAITAEKFVTRWFFDVEILRRLLMFYGRERIVNSSFELPLLSWEDKKGSKINYLRCLYDFIKLLLSREKQNLIAK